MLRRPSRNIPLVGRHLRGLLDLLIARMFLSAFEGLPVPPPDQPPGEDSSDGNGVDQPHQAAGLLGTSHTKSPVSSETTVAWNSALISKLKKCSAMPEMNATRIP